MRIVLRFTQESDSRIDVIDTTNETGAYMALIREKLEYEHHMKYDSQNLLFLEVQFLYCQKLNFFVSWN